MNADPLKVQICHLPCIVAKITAHKDGYISFKCPKDCAFRRYKKLEGPLDKWLAIEGAK